MSFPRNYELDTETIKLNAYRLLCLFYANKEIARRSDPDNPSAPASMIERRFFGREMSHLLLNIAIGLRVLDDQFRSLPTTNVQRASYFAALQAVNKAHQCMMFDDMPLREVCNKIIHASVVEPHVQEGTGAHEMDEYNWAGWSEAMEQSEGNAGPEPDPIKWEHLTCNIRLGGFHNQKPWWHLLIVPDFVNAVVELLTPNHMVQAE